MRLKRFIGGISRRAVNLPACPGADAHPSLNRDKKANPKKRTKNWRKRRSRCSTKWSAKRCR